MIKLIYKKILNENLRINVRFFLYRIRAVFFYGNNFYCNCCNKSFRKFLAKGNTPRPNAECPYCGSLERNRLLWLYFQNHPDIFRQTKTMLHIAPEYCLKRNLSKLKNIKYIDGDINPNLASHKIDITQIPYPDHFFDLIICSHVLGHIPDEHKALTELYRVLRPGGKAYLMTLIDRNSDKTFEDSSIESAEECLINYGEPDLCRLHGKDFKQRISKAGFDVTEINYAESVSLELKNRLSLGDGQRELVFISAKI